MCKAGREEEELSRLGVLCFVTGPGDLQKEVSLFVGLLLLLLSWYVCLLLDCPKTQEQGMRTVHTQRNMSGPCLA